MLKKESNGDPFLELISDYVGHYRIGRQIDIQSVRDFIRLCDPKLRQITGTTRALSVELFNDSKRIEYLAELFSPFAAAANRKGIPVPNIPFLRRSIPETLIAGKLVFEQRHEDDERGAPTMQPFLINGAGVVLGMPLQSVKNIVRVTTLHQEVKPTALMVENKETFYVLSRTLSYHCFLYTCGYPSEATAAMIRLLADSGFSLYHTGDLDPGGILILQTICTIAGKMVEPVFMNETIFERYLPWGRSLNPAMLNEIARIHNETRGIPGIGALVRRIEETRKGIEQEIIDYAELRDNTAGVRSLAGEARNAA
ncbi:MAG: DUF2220 domain-containing protein [Treponema sp.]|nr:DUF2220 domain-containing protein [Treponema sp.]